MEKTQSEFLAKRIGEVKQPDGPYTRRHYGNTLPEPAPVRRARKLIEVYEARQEREHSKRMAQWRHERHKAQEALHKGDYDKALKAVQAFEAQYESED